MMLEINQLIGAPNDWASPARPDSWRGERKADLSEPSFQDVNNPGSWDDFFYKPTLHNKKEHLYNE